MRSLLRNAAANTRLLVLHLPLMAASALMCMFSADFEILRPLKTEYTFGYWLVIVVPVCVILTVIQLCIWVYMLAEYRGFQKPGKTGEQV